MDDLEQQLRRALAPEDPPEGFADRVIAQRGVAHALLRTASRLISTPKRYVIAERRHESQRTALPRWLAAAAAVIVLAGAGYGYRWRQGEMAKREVLLAFRIASTKLNHIQTQVSR